MNTDQVILKQFINNHPQQAITLLKGLSEEEVIVFLEEGTSEIASTIISSMSSYGAANYLEKIDFKVATAVMKNIDLHAKRTILRQCDASFRNQLLGTMTPKQAAVLRKNLAFTTETIGFLMNPSLLNFGKKLTVRETIAIAKREKRRTISNIIVVDDQGKPEGIVKFRDLLFADSSTQLAGLMKTEFPTFYADESVESIKNDPGWYEYQSIPVTDRSDELIGSLDYVAVGESQLDRGTNNSNILETSNAIGELYRLGLTGLLQSVSK